MGGAQVAPRGGVRRGAGDEHHRGRCGGHLGVAQRGQRLGDRRVGGDDDRFGGHHAAGGELLVLHEVPHIGGLLRLHAGQEVLGELLGQVVDEVGGVVRVHLLQDVGRPLGLQGVQQGDLLVLGQFLEGIGQLLVGEGTGDVGALGGRHVMQLSGHVGRAHVGELGDLAVGGLVGRGQRGGDLRPRHLEERAPAGREAEALRGRLAQRRPGDLPLSVAAPAHRHVEDRGPLPVGGDDRAVEEVLEDEGLALALLEAPGVDDARQRQALGVDRLDAGHRDEDAARGEQLDDQALDPGQASGRPELRDEVADLAHLIARGVQHREALQAREEDRGGNRTHA